jgi:hypothetical protein
MATSGAFAAALAVTLPSHPRRSGSCAALLSMRPSAVRSAPEVIEGHAPAEQEAWRAHSVGTGEVVGEVLDLLAG